MNFHEEYDIFFYNLNQGSSNFLYYLDRHTQYKKTDTIDKFNNIALETNKMQAIWINMTIQQHDKGSKLRAKQRKIDRAKWQRLPGKAQLHMLVLYLQ